MDPRAGANLRRVRLEPSHSIPVVSINNNREERSEMGYEARTMGSWTVNINNNQRGGHKRNCDFCVKGDKFGDKELSLHMRSHHLEVLFKCSVCQKSFQNWTDAQRHVSYSHKGVSKKTVLIPSAPENLLKATCRLKKCRRSFMSIKCRFKRLDLNPICILQSSFRF